MKRTFFLAVVLILPLVIYNCDDAGVMVEDDYVISGTVVSWGLGERILKAVIYDSSGNSVISDSVMINAAGEFSVTLKEPPENFPHSYNIPPDTSCTGNVTIDPPASKYCHAQLNVYDLSNNWIGGLIRKNYDATVVQGSFFSDIIYLPQVTSISGTRICMISPVDSITSVFNYSGSKAWGNMVVLYSSITASNRTMEYSASEPAGGNWYFYNFLDKK